jgi:hypothetical protein
VFNCEWGIAGVAVGWVFFEKKVGVSETGVAKFEAGEYGFVSAGKGGWRKGLVGRD